MVTRVTNKRNPASALIAAVLVLATTSQNAHASLEDEFRKLLKIEVEKEISDKTVTGDIIEIRFRREFEKWKEQMTLTSTSNFHKNKSPNINLETSEVDAFRQLAQKNFGSNSATYLGIGTRFTIGLSTYINENYKLRNDLSGISSSNNFRSINGSSFVVAESNYSLGSYLDWYPSNRNFRLTAGINFNRIQHQVRSQPNTPINVNGKIAQAGENYLNITYKFPKITPFLGMGYESGTGNDYGWNGFAEVGVMIGRYDAEAKTNTLGQNSINLQDLTSEVDTNRKTLFKSRYQPVANIGLKYGY
jgi:hypothetical protein